MNGRASAMPSPPGGSRGYDHNREGITARGAWKCVERHFRDLGKDVGDAPFDVVAIDELSGDVFGNGMLLSRRIRLPAARRRRSSRELSAGSRGGARAAARPDRRVCSATAEVDRGDGCGRARALETCGRGLMETSAQRR
jgi:hypothetical protein